MLTSDLLRVTTRGRDLRPSFLDPAKGAWTEAAAELIVLWRAAAAARWRRADLDEAVDLIVGPQKEHKILRGFAKLLLDRSTFEVHGPLPPTELRRLVFSSARALGPLALEAGPLHRPTAEDVYRTVAEQLGVEPSVIADTLYADLQDQQRMVGFDDIDDPAWLVKRYNIALVQAVLLRATRLVVRANGPSGPRIRQLFRAARFHHLLFLAERDGPWCVWTLDGPESLLSQSTRYGMELATFFPWVLLLDVPWELEAEVLWRRGEAPRRLRLASDEGLAPIHADTGSYRTREQQYFLDRWAERATPWTLTDGETPLDLGGTSILVPTFTLRHADGRVAHLDMIGYWRPEWLEKRLAVLARHGPGNVIVAVSRKRKIDGGVPEVSEVPLLEFADVLPAAKVEAAAERCARPGT